MTELCGGVVAFTVLLGIGWNSPILWSQGERGHLERSGGQQLIRSLSRTQSSGTVCWLVVGSSPQLHVSVGREVVSSR